MYDVVISTLVLFTQNWQGSINRVSLMLAALLQAQEASGSFLPLKTFVLKICSWVTSLELHIYFITEISCK